MLDLMKYDGCSHFLDTQILMLNSFEVNILDL